LRDNSGTWQAALMRGQDRCVITGMHAIVLSPDTREGAPSPPRRWTCRRPAQARAGSSSPCPAELAVHPSGMIDGMSVTRCATTFIPRSPNCAIKMST